MTNETRTQTKIDEAEIPGMSTGTPCPNCGMSRNEWQGNGGLGYEFQGQMYCCEGCAEGTGCTCR